MKKFHPLRLLTAIILSASLHSIAHACTVPKTYYKHVKCTSQSGVFLAVKDNGSPVALLNSKGTKTADLFAYSAALPNRFYGGLLPVRQGNKVGYINRSGKVVIPLIYDSLGGNDWARGVGSGRIVVKKNGAFGVIDTNNRTIVAFDRQISQLSNFSKGSASITRAGKSYRIDTNGKTLGSSANTTNTQAQRGSTADNNTQTAPVNTADIAFFAREQDGKWGFVDSNGVAMIVFAFDEVRPYSEGLAAVRQGEYWGFINKAGEMVIEYRFNNDGIIKDSTDSPHLPEPFIFTNGKAWIGNLNNGAKLCINTQGVNVNCHGR